MGLGRRRLLAVTLLATLAWGSAARADDLRAKQLFEDGLVAIADGRTAAACVLFEASLAEADRPSTRFNLALANQRLGRPLEVVRNALLLLRMNADALPPDLEQRARELLVAAQSELASVDTGPLTAGATLRIDSTSALVHSDQRVYVAPGRHRFELVLGESTELVELEVTAGQVLAWPRELTVEVALSPPTPREPVPTLQKPAPEGLASARKATSGAHLRRVLTATTAGLGVALEIGALACYFQAEMAARDLARRDPMSVDFVADARSYWRVQHAILPLAITGGALMSTAVASRVRKLPSFAWGTSAVAAAVIVLAAGTALLARSPDAVIEGTDYQWPSRETGGLLLSGGLPMLTFGVRTLVDARR